MRPQQQNRRMRGRGNNNRKSPNPLSRSYESNGPDVKIRGTAQQVADKYAALARDAQSSGDRVMAENYLQHAEHYNRIIATAQAQQQQQSRDNRDDSDDNDEREAADNGNADGKQSQERVEDGTGPQPDINGVPAELSLKGQASEQSKANGHANGADANEEKPKRGRRSATAKSEDGEGGEEKPVRRTRRSRARKTDEGAEKAEAQAETPDGDGASDESARSEAAARS